MRLVISPQSDAAPEFRAMARMVDDLTVAILRRNADEEERLLRDCGECLWTARDLIVVKQRGDAVWVEP